MENRLFGTMLAPNVNQILDAVVPILEFHFRIQLVESRKYS